MSRLDHRAIDAAIGVDLFEGVGDARAILLADEGRRAGVVGQMADEDAVILRKRRRAGNDGGGRQRSRQGQSVEPWHCRIPPIRGL
ncbi:hypothetical protein [Jiella pelagia]|uniref:hypothetical protein n=1 Tax=Jiella pelagia TaxID=2986949 RepID=UPI002E2F30D3|nr:hypothetical protein [Jiella pelagia]